MKITFLGTGTSMGVPVIACKCAVCQSTNPKDKRLRSSVLIQTKGKNFVIDTTPDFREQMLRHPIQHLTAILFTHEHRDHVAGLDDVRAFNFILEQDVHVYAEQRVLANLKQVFPYIFAEKKYPGVPELSTHLINNKPFKIEETEIIPIRAMHHKLPILGFRFGNFTYITDANFISDSEKEKIKGSEVLVLNALRKEKHISHYTLQQAINLVQELEIPKAYFTHLSHQMGTHDEVSKELPPNIKLAFDGLVITL